jgi:predicted Zn-dependent protease
MLDTEAFAEFRKALGFLRDDYPESALPHIRRASQLEEHNPFYQSYLGLTLARAEKKWNEAEKLCDNALRLKRDQPQLYLNLAEVYIAAGRRQDAMETLTMGAKYAQRDARIQRLMSQISSRRPPVLSFLDRGHVLNRGLGRWRHKSLRIIQGESDSHDAIPEPS